MKKTIQKLLKCTCMLSLVSSALIPSAVNAEEGDIYGNIGDDPVISETELTVREITAPESENDSLTMAQDLEMVTVIVEMEEPCVLEAGLDPAGSEGMQYAQQLISSHDTFSQSVKIIAY